MSRAGEFTERTKDLAYERDEGKCRKCGSSVRRHGPATNFDHMRPLAAGGDNSLANCATMCLCCHEVKTRGTGATTYGSDIFEIAKTRRLERKRMGMPARKRQSRPLRSRNTLGKKERQYLRNRIDGQR